MYSWAQCHVAKFNSDFSDTFGHLFSNCERRAGYALIDYWKNHPNENTSHPLSWGWIWIMVNDWYHIFCCCRSNNGNFVIRSEPFSWMLPWIYSVDGILAANYWKKYGYEYWKNELFRFPISLSRTLLCVVCTVNLSQKYKIATLYASTIDIICWWVLSAINLSFIIMTTFEKRSRTTMIIGKTFAFIESFCVTVPFEVGIFFVRLISRAVHTYIRISYTARAFPHSQIQSNSLRCNAKACCETYKVTLIRYAWIFHHHICTRFNQAITHDPWWGRSHYYTQFIWAALERTYALNAYNILCYQHQLSTLYICSAVAGGCLTDAEVQNIRIWMRHILVYETKNVAPNRRIT